MTKVHAAVPVSQLFFAGIGVKEGLAEKALDSVKEKLDTKYGVMILQPAYTKYHLELGEIAFTEFTGQFKVTESLRYTGIDAQSLMCGIYAQNMLRYVDEGPCRRTGQPASGWLHCSLRKRKSGV